MHSLLPWIIIAITSEFLFTNLKTIIIIPFLWSYSFFLHSTSEIDLYSWLEHETTVNIVSFNYLLNFFEKTNFNQKNIYSLLSTIYPYRELINLACTWKISKLRIFPYFSYSFHLNNNLPSNSPVSNLESPHILPAPSSFILWPTLGREQQRKRVDQNRFSARLIIPLSPFTCHL